jgi:hypothetical protein
MGVEMKKCGHCGIGFAVGGKGNPRPTRRFCSRKCGVAQRDPATLGSSAPRPKKNKHTLHDEAWLRRKYEGEKLGMPDIAILCSCSTQSVFFAMKKFGIERRSISQSRTGKAITAANYSTGNTSIDKSRRMAHEKRQALKSEMIAAYGGKCECCGESEPAFLSLDHRSGGGGKERKESGGQAKLMRLLRLLGWPKDRYRCLCMNCQTATKFGKTCPHQMKKQNDTFTPTGT